MSARPISTARWRVPYAEALLQKQELNKVDGISGATLSYKQFFDAAQRALEEAGK